MSYYFARRRLAKLRALAPAYPGLPFYFESYAPGNNAYQWRNLGTAGGAILTEKGMPGRVLSNEELPFYQYPSSGAFDTWELPNISATPSDYTFYVLLRGTDKGFDSSGVGAYVLDFQKPNGVDRTIFGYSRPDGTAEIGVFYQNGQFVNQGVAPRAEPGTIKVFIWVCQQGQPVRVYDETNQLVYTSSITYSPFAINSYGLAPTNGNLLNQTLGSSIGSGRTVGADFGGFAADTKVHDAATRAAVVAKWRADLKF